MKRILKTTLISGALALIFSSPLMAMEVGSVGEARQETARELASLANDPAFKAALDGQLHHDKAMLADVLREYHASEKVADNLHDLERQAIYLRGLDGAVNELLGLRLQGGVAAKSKAGAGSGAVWAGTVVKNPKTGAKELVAYDPAGAEHRYPANAAPAVPMLMVESKSSAATSAGMRVMNETMRSSGLQTVSPKAASRDATGTEDLTILTDIYLTNDSEPDLLMDADVYAIVSGVSPEGKAEIVNVALPWLDHDRHWYAPRQDLITWKNFGANYVNVQLFEDDGDTNYKELATTVVGNMGDLAILISPSAPPALVVAGVTKIANEILKVMPGKWFENSADYIDSFYVIERGSHYTRNDPLVGARGWARIGIKPYEPATWSPKGPVTKTPFEEIRIPKGQ